MRSLLMEISYFCKINNVWVLPKLMSKMCFVIEFLIYDIFCQTLATYCGYTFVRHLRCGDFIWVGELVCSLCYRWLCAPIYELVYWGKLNWSRYLLFAKWDNEVSINSISYGYLVQKKESSINVRIVIIMWVFLISTFLKKVIWQPYKWYHGFCYTDF